MSRQQLVLVPSEAHVDAALARAEGGARARTFRGFLEDAAARLRPDVRLASPHATRLLARRALQDLPSRRLRLPGEPAAQVSLAAAVDRAIGRLRRAGVRPEDLREVSAPEAALLAAVLERVDEDLHRRGLADARAAAGLVARALAKPAAIEALDLPGALRVTGLCAFEPDDLAALEALHAGLVAQGGRGVTVELPRLPPPLSEAPFVDGEVGDPVARVADALERRWASLPDAPSLDWVAPQGGELAGILAGRTVDAEARAVAAAVLQALAAGTPPERIAVVVPELDEAALEPLRAALGDARIAFTEPRGRPAGGSPEGKVALSLLSLATGPVTREEVLALLRAPGLHPGAWTERSSHQEAKARAAQLAHRLREVPVEIDRTGRLLVESLSQRERDHDRERRREGASPARDASPEDDWMARSLERLLAGARWLAEDGSGDGLTRRELGRRLWKLLDRLELGLIPEAELHAALRSEGKGAGGIAARALGEGSAAVRAVRESARALIEAARLVGLGDEPVGPADFTAELSQIASELGTGLLASTTSARAGAVRLARPADVAGLGHDLLIITGLAERAYSGAEGDLALLGPRVERELPPASRPPSARDREAARSAELAWAMGAAARVVLAFAAGDEPSAPPHPLVRWARDAGVPERVEPASRVGRQASVLDARGAELRSLAAGVLPRGELAERAAIERGRLAFFLDPRAPGDAFSGRVFLADEPAALRLQRAVGGDSRGAPVAVTAIERAAGCAFAGFSRRVLRVRRVEDLTESADARERGTLVHRALDAAFAAARDAGWSAERKAALTAARAAAERAVGARSSMTPLRRESVGDAVSDALSVVRRALDEPAFRFSLAEQGFGPREGAPDRGYWPALELPDPEGAGPSVFIDGQIDRIDVSPDRRRARVVDYKTGKLPVGDEHGRTAFQLPLYAKVVAAALGTPEVEAMYVSVRPRGLVEEYPKVEEGRLALGARRDEVATAARRVIVGLWQGEASPRPVKAALCARCEARDICRRPAVAPVDED